MHPKDINIENYKYVLASDKIAQRPVNQRDESNLLVADKNFKKDKFKNIYTYLPEKSLIIFNDTRVIQARLEFRKNTGARIEIFLLNPVSPVTDIENSFNVKEKTVWNCFIGNRKKWKSEILEKNLEIGGKFEKIKAEYIESKGNSHHVSFCWNEAYTFGEIIENAGKIPLPPYMNRSAEEMDSERYQTIYARQRGSVAAPTAGLHFTPSVLNSLVSKNIITDFVTLDVGAGTFKPVTSSTMGNHEMHIEKVYIKRETIEQILAELGTRKIIAVGTTTTRTLESLYWFGKRLESNSKAIFSIDQWEPYENENNSISTEKALLNVLNNMNENSINILQGQTQIIIAPGYKFKIIDILITNFHQPGSTLLLLVAAFYGEKWRDAYSYAMENKFRFLSYGDSCLFFKKD